MASPEITVQKVETKKDWKEFLLLPWEIYRGNPCWVPPLVSDIKERLDTGHYPFWQHAEREVFIAKKNGKTTGRIAAIIDRNHNDFHNEKMGFFGFFECVDELETAAALIEEASRWTKSKGMTALRGPVSPSLNDECAFLLEGYDLPPAFMMPYNPPYYHKLMEGCGLKKAKDLLSLLKRDVDGMTERLVKMIDRMKKRMRVNIRSFNLREFDRDVQICKDIYNAAWEKNWGFVPMTNEEMDYSAKQIKSFGDPDLICIGEVDGNPAGLGITVPNLNEVLAKLNGRLGLTGALKFLYYKNRIKGTRSLIGGVKKEYRNTGIIAAMSYRMEKILRKKGYKWCEFGWNLEDNDLINSFDQAIGGKIYKKYRLYEKGI